MNRRQVRGADDSRELVNEMRSLARATQPAGGAAEARTGEQQACLAITTWLMLLLILVLFATSALPDLLPRLHTIQAAL